MGECKFCLKKADNISQILSICRQCLLNEKWSLIKPYIEGIHENARKTSGLRGTAPKVSKLDEKLKCNLCLNECSIGNYDTSYCGLRNLEKHQKGELLLPTKNRGYIHGYIDANPTNCCNSWFCPAGTKNGYPLFSNVNGPEYGTYSYAAFLYGCTFSCLFCQNSSHKHIDKRNLRESENLANEIIKNEKITCLCFFGGTPESQLPFSINLAELILENIEKKNKNRKFRICWECNGSGDKDLMEKCLEIAIKSGGNIKFDLKSFNEKLNLALCGVSNKRTLENFEHLAKKYYGIRGKDMPELSGCTLMVPGYVNSKEVELIAKFIGNINPDIPYSLLVFHGDYQMRDLPITPKEQAMQCYNTAKKYLNNVNIGNKFLLGFS